MEYEGQICRSPMERSSFMLPVAVGCSHNACHFCMLFKHLRYRPIPLEEVFAEIDRIVSVGGNPKRIFLGDGNAFSLPTDTLAAILRRCREAFPALQSVGMDSHVQNILEKSPEELRALRELGLRDLYLGIECGLEDVLQLMEKGNTLREAEQAVEKLHAAGLDYDAHIMSGICGKGRGEENAEALAAFLNRTKPLRICNFSLFFHRSSPLYKDYEKGLWQPADERENLFEDLCLLERLSDFDCDYDGMHDFLPVRVRGNLRKDREKMCAKLREEIAKLDAQPEKIQVAIWH